MRSWGPTTAWHCQKAKHPPGSLGPYLGKRQLRALHVETQTKKAKNTESKGQHRPTRNLQPLHLCPGVRRNPKPFQKKKKVRCTKSNGRATVALATAGHTWEASWDCHQAGVISGFGVSAQPLSRVGLGVLCWYLRLRRWRCFLCYAFACRVKVFQGVNPKP